jgi:MOSC domain-containing protein YiiM
VKGKIIGVNISKSKGVAKKNVERGELRVDWGLEGDAHAGPWHRQVSLLAWESIEKMRAQGLNVREGSFAENITTEGLELHTLPVGTQMRLGSALVEVTQIGNLCHSKCAIFEKVGDCVMPREGIFVRVLEPGEAAVGDVVETLDGLPDGSGTQASVGCEPEGSIETSEPVQTHQLHTGGTLDRHHSG